MATEQPSFLVALGGGAGSLFALAQFFKCLPADTGCTFLVMRTIDEPGLSMCAAMIGRATDMRVVRVTESTDLHANTVYLLDSRCVPEVVPGALRLHPPQAVTAQSEQRATPGRLDVLLESLAASWAERAVAVVLSGDGTHGTDASVALADAGALVLAQAPDTAECAQMPQHVIQRGCVHSNLPPADLAGLLCAFVTGCADGEAGSFFGQRYAGLRQLQALHRRIADAGDTSSHGLQPLIDRVFDAHEASLLLDANGSIVKANRSFLDLFGYESVALIGRQPDLVIAQLHDPLWRDAMRESLRCDGAWRGELLCRRSDDSVFACWHRISAVRAAGRSVSHYVATYADISDRRRAEERVKRLALTDSLTGLPNRRLVLERLQTRIAGAAQQKAWGAVLMLDLERFRTLNATLGHAVGDQLLRQVGRRLRHELPAIDLVGRLSGDEFFVVPHQLDETARQAAHRASACAARLRDSLQKLFVINGIAIESGASIGICLYGKEQTSVDTLLRHADLALIQARRAGRQKIRFYNPVMQAQVDARTVLDLSLRRAIAQGDLMLMYQPQFDRAGRLMGAEGLIRWRDQDRGLVLPGEFIAHAEQSGLILPIGQWVLETACQQLVAWSRHAATRDLRLSINISPRQLRQADFAEVVKAQLAESGANPALLQFELTENVLLDDPEQAIARMHEIRALGVGISIDDFGTGYSSLSYLKRLPVDQLKIDKSFINDLHSSRDDAAIVRAIIDMGRSMSLQVFAEGVETREQHEFLASHGCDAFQGYLFGKPVAGTGELLAAVNG